MSTKYCDRCYEEIEGEPSIISFNAGKTFKVTEILELCKKCAITYRVDQALKKYINEHPDSPAFRNMIPYAKNGTILERELINIVKQKLHMKKISII